MLAITAGFKIVILAGMTLYILAFCSLFWMKLRPVSGESP
jgi:hypothetical protein